MRANPDPITKELLSLREEFDQLKTAQVLGGKNIIGYITNSGQLNDGTFHLLGSAITTYSLKFTHDSSVYGSLQLLSAFYSIDNPDVLNNYVPPWANGPAIAANWQKLPPTNTQNDKFGDDATGQGAVASKAISAVKTLAGNLWAMGALSVVAALAAIKQVTTAITDAINLGKTLTKTTQVKQSAVSSINTTLDDAQAKYKAGKITSAQLLAIQKIAQKDLGELNNQKHALGTNFAPTDSFIAGENGPELVTGAKGAKVTPANKTAQMLGSSGKTVHIENLNVNNNVDMRQLVKYLGWRLATA